jgi:hypothetical protein
MTRLQQLIAHAPTGFGTARTDGDRAAFPGLGLAIVIAVLAVAILLGTTILQPGTGSTVSDPAAEVDGWAPAVRAATRERTMERAAVTVDGWSPALLAGRPEVVDGWSARFLGGE